MGNPRGDKAANSSSARYLAGHWCKHLCCRDSQFDAIYSQSDIPRSGAQEYLDHIEACHEEVQLLEDGSPARCSSCECEARRSYVPYHEYFGLLNCAAILTNRPQYEQCVSLRDCP